MPDLAELIKRTKVPAQGDVAEEEEEMMVKFEPVQTIFGGHLIPKLIERCTDMIDIADFGPEMIAFAAQVFNKSIGEPMDAQIWVPSKEWCCWFMHVKLDLVPRRITSHSTASPAQIELQRQLHELNVDAIAIALKEGLPDWAILGSDEFGQNLFPVRQMGEEGSKARHL